MAYCLTKRRNNLPFTFLYRHVMPTVGSRRYHWPASFRPRGGWFLIHGKFNLGRLYAIEWNRNMIMNGEQERILKKIVLAYLKIQSWHSPKETEHLLEILINICNFAWIRKLCLSNLFSALSSTCSSYGLSFRIRVSGYRSRGPGFDSRRFQIFWDAVGLERGPLSLVSTREYNWGATWKK
jgi:hypothetical protein